MGFWPAAIGASLLANLGLEAGRLKYNYYNGLKKTISQNDRIINRLKFKNLIKELKKDEQSEGKNN